MAPTLEAVMTLTTTAQVTHQTPPSTIQSIWKVTLHCNNWSVLLRDGTETATFGEGKSTITLLIQGLTIICL